MSSGRSVELEAVVKPKDLLAGADQARLFEQLELELQLGLGQIQVGGEDRMLCQ